MATKKKTAKKRAEPSLFDGMRLAAQTGKEITMDTNGEWVVNSPAVKKRWEVLRAAQKRSR
jgi:hypothetical protein